MTAEEMAMVAASRRRLRHALQGVVDLSVKLHWRALDEGHSCDLCGGRRERTYFDRDGYLHVEHCECQEQRR